MRAFFVVHMKARNFSDIPQLMSVWCKCMVAVTTSTMRLHVLVQAVIFTSTSKRAHAKWICGKIFCGYPFSSWFFARCNRRLRHRERMNWSGSLHNKNRLFSMIMGFTQSLHLFRCFFVRSDVAFFAHMNSFGWAFSVFLPRSVTFRLFAHIFSLNRGFV